MSKHLSENTKWSQFLNAATNSNAIDVFSVTKQHISFTTNDISVLEAFNNPDKMRADIIHAYSNNRLEENAPLHPNAEQFIKVLSYTGSQIISNLIDQNFLDSHQINLESVNCADNYLAKVITCNIYKQTTKTVLFKQQQVNFGYLQSMLRDPEEIREVLVGNKPILTEEYFTGEDSNFGQQVLTINELDKNHAVVKFNYGYIVESAQNHYGFGAPVIYSPKEATEQYTVSKDNLLNYVYEIFPAGVIFTKAGNQLQPIMFQPMTNKVAITPTKTIFDISLDRSGSMDRVFPEYQKKIINIVEQITSKTANWSLTLTAFDDRFETVTFDSSNTQGALDFINNLSARDATALYDNMHNRLSEIAKTSSSENAVLIIFTDGSDNRSRNNAESITKLALEIREANPQFSMYTMGYGDDYTASFFRDMSSNGGFTHIHLGSLDQVQEFNQYIDTINNCKVVYVFENGAAKFFEQCAAGDISISSTLVSDQSSITIAGQTYAIGLEAL